MHVKWHIDLSTDAHKKKELEKKQNSYYFIGIILLVLLLICNMGIYIKIHNEGMNYKAKVNPELINDTTWTLLELNNEFSYVNNLIEKKNFSWSKFLSQLESTVPQGKISITSVNPSFSGGNVSIDGVANSIDDLIKFMKNLQNSANFKNAFLNEQRNASESNVSFNISFKYFDTENK